MQKDQYSLELFLSIEDLPMWNFRKVTEKNDLRYLYKLENYAKLPKEYPSYTLWDDIFWEYVEAKGLSREFKFGLELRAKLAILENEQIFEKKNNHVKIEMTKLKIKEYQKNNKIKSELETDAILTKFMGIAINPKIHTVSQYIGFEKLLIESNKPHGKDNR